MNAILGLNAMRIMIICHDKYSQSIKLISYYFAANDVFADWLFEQLDITGLPTVS